MDYVDSLRHYSTLEEFPIESYLWSRAPRSARIMSLSWAGGPNPGEMFQFPSPVSSSSII
jgi:hypothetical protein